MKKLNKKSLSIALLTFFAPSLAFSAGVADTVDELEKARLENSLYTLSDTTTSNFTVKKYLETADGLSQTTLYLDLTDITGSYDSTYYFTWNYATNKRNVVLTKSTTADDGYDFSVNYDSSVERLSNLTEGVESDFVGLSLDSDNGGAINNSTTTEAYDITGNFIGNSISGSAWRSGGAIFNAASAKIGNITGSFIGNSASSTGTNKGAQGGAVFNNTAGTIGDITGDFIANYTYTTSAGIPAYGGAICNYGSIGNITGDFISNYASSYTTGVAHGGAIKNTSSISSITGDFIGNAAYTGTTGNAQGGAIWNSGTTSVTGDFIENYASSGTTGTAFGGAIYNESTTTDAISVEGNFVGNYATSGSGTAFGGAVYNAGTITFKASDTDGVGSSYYYQGNYAGSSDADGGFLYQTSAGVSNFVIDTNSSIVIGDGTDGYDSIAGEGSIVVSGGGDLVVNSSMEYYTGSLTVSAGDMEVKNTLSASTITVASGASLAVDVLNVYLSDATSSLTLSVDGTFTFDALAVYLDEAFIANVGSYLNEDIDIIGGTSIDEFSAYYYDSETESYLELSDEAYTFENGVFTLTTAVPEPSTYAMIIGVLALGFAYYRRRK